MGRSVYVASAEGFSGKSTVALGLLEQLSRRVGKVGVFRPVVRSGSDSPDGRDYVLDLLTSHEAVTLSYEECAGVTYDDVHKDPTAALDRIVERYHEVADVCDVVVIVGTDYTDVGSPTEFSYNARLAANLGAPVLLVLNGYGRTPDELRTMAAVAVAELRAQHGTLLAVVANRVDAADVLADAEAITVDSALAYALPEQPLLSAPSLADLMRACGGSLVSGDENLLGRETTGLVVAAMTLPNVLDRLFEGAVVVTPGDRPEIVLGVITAHLSTGFPQMSGIVLNGGLSLHEQVSRLLDGLGTTMPIVETDLGTHATTTALNSVRGRLTKDSPRKVQTAIQLFAEHVDGETLLDRFEVARTDAVTPLMFEHQLVDRAGADRKHIVLPEGDEERVLRAADILLRRGIVDLTLLGDPIRVNAAAAGLGVDISGARLVSPQNAELVDRFAREYYERRKHKGVELGDARTLVTDVSYFGTLMVELGLADGMVSGAVHTTAHTIRPALEIVKTTPGVSVVSSVFFMCLENQVLVYGDCAVNPDPTAEQLADIAVSSARTAAAFGVEPRVAMLSYSTGTSGAGTDVEKVSAATALVKQKAPDLLVEGPIQYDAAIDVAVARTKLPGSEVAGRATVFVFPDLNTGNNTYKAVQRSAGAVAIGPVLQGLRKPVNDLSRGATVRDIVNTVAITAIQAQGEGHDA
ncbi:phosphate acetyltransferase [Nocardioides iriomotensis]|uniref:Phosphate acetyltransferase n=1 Tax=Nocardioides iriomotensis TaxID=715784 RepID=A0A4Q5IXU6_9ACTN|nr:phosphate acetyltransferase [Nocardioides iriomotensis]RYU09715.1 phosphate acetyltransferase [Nocardioides iriomotensis]